MGFDVDIRHFEQTLRRQLELTKRDESEEVLKRARNIAYKAAQDTPIEDSRQIRSDLIGNPKLLAKLTAIHIRKTRGPNAKLAPGEFRNEMLKFARARAASARYLRVGWRKSIEDLGGTFRGSKAAPPPEARNSPHGYGKRPTLKDLIALIVWQVDERTEKDVQATEAIAMKAIQSAIVREDKDLAEHIAKKISKNFS